MKQIKSSQWSIVGRHTQLTAVESVCLALSAVVSGEISDCPTDQRTKTETDLSDATMYTSYVSFFMFLCSAQIFKLSN